MADENLKTGSLSAHNAYRKDHGAPPLIWSTRLQDNAQKWANELAKSQKLKHSGEQEEGENLSCAMGKDLTGQNATDMWYEEVKNYNFDSPGFNPAAGHFTQVVWVGSKELGVAKAVSENGKQYIVAKYHPRGNNTKTFRENVFPKGTGLQSTQLADDESKAGPVSAEKSGAGRICVIL